MPPADAPDSTGRRASQGLGITEGEYPPPSASGAPAAPVLMGNGAHMGRGKLPVSEVVASVLEDLGRRVAEAVARCEFERARELTEEAIRIRAAQAPG